LYRCGGSKENEGSEGSEEFDPFFPQSSKSCSRSSLLLSVGGAVRQSELFSVSLTVIE
jgi:hypothetical protein